VEKALHGIVPALVTPFKADERIDFGAWQTIIDLMIASGVDGLFATGGRGILSLEPEERVVALRFCRQYVARARTGVRQRGAVTTRETVKLRRRRRRRGSTTW